MSVGLLGMCWLIHVYPCVPTWRRGACMGEGVEEWGIIPSITPDLALADLLGFPP